MQHKWVMDKDLLMYSQKVNLDWHYMSKKIKHLENFLYIKYRMLLNLQKWLYPNLLFSLLKDVEIFSVVLWWKKNSIL